MPGRADDEGERARGGWSGEARRRGWAYLAVPLRFPGFKGSMVLDGKRVSFSAKVLLKAPHAPMPVAAPGCIVPLEPTLSKA